jgi:hypothetical protein
MHCRPRQPPQAALIAACVAASGCACSALTSAARQGPSHPLVSAANLNPPATPPPRPTPPAPRAGSDRVRERACAPQPAASAARLPSRLPATAAAAARAATPPPTLMGPPRPAAQAPAPPTPGSLFLSPCAAPAAPRGRAVAAGARSRSGGAQCLPARSETARRPAPRRVTHLPSFPARSLDRPAPRRCRAPSAPRAISDAAPRALQPPEHLLLAAHWPIRRRRRRILTLAAPPPQSTAAAAPTALGVRAHTHARARRLAHARPATPAAALAALRGASRTTLYGRTSVVVFPLASHTGCGVAPPARRAGARTPAAPPRADTLNSTLARWSRRAAPGPPCGGPAVARGACPAPRARRPAATASSCGGNQPRAARRAPPPPPPGALFVARAPLFTFGYPRPGPASC